MTKRESKTTEQTFRCSSVSLLFYRFINTMERLHLVYQIQNGKVIPTEMQVLSVFELIESVEDLDVVKICVKSLAELYTALPPPSSFSAPTNAANIIVNALRIKGSAQDFELVQLSLFLYIALLSPSR